jgi:hypothetical protein
LDSDGVTDTRAVRWPLLAVMDTGTSTCSTEAMLPSVTGLPAAGRGILRTASMLVNLVP